MITLGYVIKGIKRLLSEKYNMLVNSIMNDRFNNVELEERTLDINLIKEGNEWKIKKDKTFNELILGSYESNKSNN